MAIHSSILAWRIPWTEEPGGLKSMELQILRHNRLPHTHPSNTNSNATSSRKPLISILLRSAYDTLTASSAH